VGSDADADYTGYGATAQRGTFVAEAADGTVEGQFAATLIDAEVIDSLEELRGAFAAIQEGFSRYDFLMRSDTNLKYPTVSGTSVTVSDLPISSEVPTSSLLAAHSQELPEIRRVEITGKIDSTYVFPYHTSYDYYSNLALSIDVGFNGWLPSAVNPERTSCVIKVDPANSGSSDPVSIESWMLDSPSSNPTQKYAQDSNPSNIFANSGTVRRKINTAVLQLIANLSQPGFIKVLSEMSGEDCNRFFIPVIGATAPSTDTESFLLAITLKHALEYNSNGVGIEQVSDSFVTQLCNHALLSESSNPWNMPSTLTTSFGRGDGYINYNINLAKRRAFAVAYLLGVSLFCDPGTRGNDAVWTRELGASLEGKVAHLKWYRTGPLPATSNKRVQLFRCFGVGSMFCDDRGQNNRTYLDTQRRVAIDFAMTRTSSGLAFNSTIAVPGQSGACDGISAQLVWTPSSSRTSTATLDLGLSRDANYRNSYVPLVTSAGETYTVSAEQHYTPLKPLTQAAADTAISPIVGGTVTEDMLKRFLADRGRARRAMDDVARVAGANFERLFGITTAENILDRLVIEVA
jgi:hypothetical protein